MLTFLEVQQFALIDKVRIGFALDSTFLREKPVPVNPS